MLFVPGSRPDRFAKAAASGADAVVLDLEDAVAPADKARAREQVRRWRAQGGAGIVRVNDRRTRWYREDLASLEGPAVVLLPKTGTADDVEDVRGLLAPESWVIPILETAQGIVNAPAIAAVPGVARLAFGNGDLAAELGVAHTSHRALAAARSAVVLAAAAAGIAPPLDGVTTAIDDEALLAADTRHARELGFTGRLCIHPRQIAATHRELAPSREEIRWARSVVDSVGTGAATVVNGGMVDQPILARARALLAQASRAPAEGLASRPVPAPPAPADTSAAGGAK
ncbi:MULTISPECIES: CoA ester lyase [Actinomycetes]|uniref:HpcH/HpaI aldolase/citrate lyase family protein n=1 Tax=Actinomycetes TaxID=1760 RepID=UPI0001B566E8|nr:MULTISPECIES: CoA ester lyase [Actinomycetes]EFL12589.1 citrate (Pro-3S)-lyase, beta subunit [Streptomyces sp. AA4]